MNTPPPPPAQTTATPRNVLPGNPPRPLMFPRFRPPSASTTVPSSSSTPPPEPFWIADLDELDNLILTNAPGFHRQFLEWLKRASDRLRI